VSKDEIVPELDDSNERSNPMKAINISRHTMESAPIGIKPDDPKRNVFTGRVYRLHGYKVLDVHGQKAGSVSWLWAGDDDQDAFIGVHLQWLRGKARAIPVSSIQFDERTSTVRVPYPRNQIVRGRRHKIDRVLTPDQKRAIWSHYALTPTSVLRREHVPGLASWHQIESPRRAQRQMSMDRNEHAIGRNQILSR
jgi:hypothetical protein